MKMHAIVTFLLLLSSTSLHFGRTEDVGLSEEALARRINAFGCNLLGGVYDMTAAEDNILVSPVNAYATLSLLHLGADDQTLDQLSAIMKVSDIKNSTEVYHRLHSILSRLSSTSQDHSSKYHETVLANGIFMQNDFPIKDSYIQSAKKYFDSLAKNVDFRGHSQESTDFINEWISKNTKGRIAKFYENPLSPGTRAVLTSALYFNAKWKNSFPQENTKSEKFHTASAEIEVPMMSSLLDLYYTRDDTLHYDSVTLPYSGREYEMTVYLQHTEHGSHGSLAYLFHKLSEQKFVTKTTQRSRVHLKLPKMKFSWKSSVVKALQLENIFKEAHEAEMTPLRNVTISDMMHATELEVDEKGTIATAATALEIALTSALVTENTEPIMFHVDRPFMMTITHKPTQTILFAGIIRKPIE